MYQHKETCDWIDLRYTLDEIENGDVNYYGAPSGFKLIAKRQCIEIKDKNGVDIYEGDVVRCSNEYRTVKIWMGNACLCVSGNSTGFPIYPYNVNNHVEVIGNIYENPVLLNRESEDDEISEALNMDQALIDDIENLGIDALSAHVRISCSDAIEDAELNRNHESDSLDHYAIANDAASRFMKMCFDVEIKRGE